MMPMNQQKEFDRNYLNVILEISKHIDGYIDAYIGPARLKQESDAQPSRSPILLLDDVARLLDTIPTEDGARHAYLTAMLRAVETTLLILAGEDIPYMEEVQRIYDIMPQRVGEDLFSRAHGELETLLPGNSPLSNRLEAWRGRYHIPQEMLLSALQLVQKETRLRTAALIDLPAGETVDVKLITDKPWSAYNWFKGNSRSLIEFNTDIPISALGLVALFAHEGYPGHHSEGVIKERKFWLERGYGEAAAMLLHSPAAVIAEGIATTAVEIIFPKGGHMDWTVDVLLPAIPIEAQESAEQFWRLEEAMRHLRSVSGNAAILFHTGQLTSEQTIEYIQTYELATPERAQKSFSFITHPLFRSYIFTYTEGYDLISRAAGAENKTDVFLSCLIEQKLPSQLAAQGAKLARGSLQI
jgi:hypothetical protein